MALRTVKIYIKTVHEFAYLIRFKKYILILTQIVVNHLVESIIFKVTY